MLAQAAGPAAAGFLVAALSPGMALAAAAGCALSAAACVAALPATPVRREPGHSPTGLLADVHEGFRYMVRTPWLLSTLAFASVMLLVFMGPFEVLVPFAIKDAGGGPSQHAWVLAAFGLGGALGLTGCRLVAAAPPLSDGDEPAVGPRLRADGGLRLLLAVLGHAGGRRRHGRDLPGRHGHLGNAAAAPGAPALLGRISSLDFFVSLSFMPLSMAVAGPVSELIGLTATFLLAGLAPPLFAVVAIVAARQMADEIAHPLDTGDEPAADEALPGEERLDRV